jgi:uncharacterized protein
MSKTTSKLHPFPLVLFVILFFTGCGGKTTVKNDATKTDNLPDIASTDDSTQPVTGTEQKIQLIENLFNQSINNKLSEKNSFLTKALLLCSQILTQNKLTTPNKLIIQEVTPEQYERTMQLAIKIIAQIEPSTLNHEQKNQFFLTSSAISLAKFQSDEVFVNLNQSFNSIDAEQWSQYHKLRAMAQFQTGQKSPAIKELIIRHGYLSNIEQKQENQNMIWKYLSSTHSFEQKINVSDNSLPDPKTSTEGLAESERLYTGWLELAKAFRGTHDPQSINHLTNFWLQSYPNHQADRFFINQIIQARQESLLNIKNIAILLPFQGKLANPAKAIRDGILASHFQSTLADTLQLRFYDTSRDTPIQNLYQQAIDNGAEFIIGPLAKNNVKTLIESMNNEISTLTPTLALNSIENLYQQNKTNSLYQFGLSPEAEARKVAEKGRLDGHFYAAILVPDNSWGKRMKTAFAEQWHKSGGKVVEMVDFHAQNHDFSDAIKSMLNIDQSETRKKLVRQTIGRKMEFTPRRRQDIDMLFMAADPRQAKQIPLQIIYHHGETIPVYSTSRIVADYHNAKKNIDMDDVYFSDMPFLLGLAQDATSLQNMYQNTLYQRLFAMGVDSYQIAPFVRYLSRNPSESFSGDTGQLTINSSGYIIRSLPWATFNQGKIKIQSVLLEQNSNINQKQNQSDVSLN